MADEIQNTVPLITTTGNVYQAQPHEVQELLQQGYTQPSQEQIAEEAQHQKYGTLGQQIITGAEGAASAATFGGSTAVERALGVPTEDIRKRREENPASHGIGQGVGLVASAFVPGLGEAEAVNALSASSVLKGIGEAAAKLGPEGEGIAAAIARGGMKGAAETAAFQAGDEASKMISQDPNQSLQTAAINVGMAGLLGGVTGGAFGAVSPLWKAANGSKMGQALADFKGRANEWINNPDPAEAVTKELQQHYENVKSMADEVYGARGLKSQEISKLMPEATAKNVEKIAGQANEILDQMGQSLEKLGDDPHARTLQRMIEEYHGNLAKDPTPQGVFNATQELKQKLHEFGKVSPIAPPAVGDRAFISTAQNLAKGVKESLEDSSVWGDAANRQKSINKAFSEYLPALKDFEKRFTVPFSDGSRQIDPQKVATYVNNLGKPSAEIKQSMLSDFLGASEKYQKVIGDTHANLGLENPFEPTSLTATHKTLDTLTPGARLFDALVKKGMGGSTLGKAVAGSFGAGLGSVVGHPAIGALLGEHSLGPLFDSVFPSMIRPILDGPVSAEGAKVATDYGMQVVRSVYIATKATESIFDHSKETIPARLVASSEDTKKLDDKLKSLQKDPSPLMDNGGHVGHYLPSHASALGQTTASAVNYLNAQRPEPQKPSALDKEIPPTTAQNQAFQRTLKIAQQPLTVLQYIKDGTLQSKDIKDLVAVYPQLYQGLKQKVYSSMLDHVSKGGKINYPTRMNVSLFLGDAIDPTFKSAAIQSAQNTFLNEGPQAQAPKATKSGTSHISKLSSLAETPSQARESSRNAK